MRRYSGAAKRTASQRCRLTALWLALVTVLLAMSWAPPVSAKKEKVAKKKLQTRKAKLVSYRKWVAMTVAWRDVVNAEIRRKLLSGLPTVIATRAYAFPDKGEKPVSLSVKSCRIVFDLWDEVFRIDLRQGGRRKKTVAVNVEGVLRRCAEARRLPVVSMKMLKPKQRYFVGVLVEVNPLSKKMLERIKRWVARPKGAGAVGPGDSLFGSFVGLFITHVPEADRVVSFRTQAFVPAKLPVVKVKKKKEKKRASR